MLGFTEFVLICAALAGLGLLLYCASVLRRIDRATQSIRFLLFRDYEEDLSDRGMRPLLQQPTKAKTEMSSTRRH
jgi:hypothetical protein